MDPAKVVNPVLVATILAVVVRYAGIDTFIPKFLIDGIQMVGAMSVPLLMLVLGGNIYIDLRGSGKPAYQEPEIRDLKNLVFPLVTRGGCSYS